MNNIKVTVAYEKPTTSKFDALMAEYEAAKKMADETVAYYKPLADAAEEAKFNAVLEQLETIKGYAKRISEITGNNVSLQVWIGSCRFDIDYYPSNGHCNVAYGGCLFTMASANRNRSLFFEGCNLIGRWDELKAYQALEEEAFRCMRKAIDVQKKRAEYQTKRLHNIVKEEN